MKKLIIAASLAVGFMFALPGASLSADKKHGKANKAQAAENEKPAKDQSQKMNGFDKMPAPGTKAFCPVMKAEFEVKKDSTYSKHNGKYYVFCCPGCKKSFEEDPSKYVK